MIVAHCSPYPISSGSCIFVDYSAINERVTNSEQTNHCTNFRRDVVQRDGRCMATQCGAHYCDAAHLIPYGKGDDVRIFIIILCGLLTMIFLVH